MSDLVGRMDKVCHLLQNNPQALGAGNQDQYTVLLTTRGYLRKVNGNRASVTADILVENTWQLTVRKQNALVLALNASLKWRIDGRIFTIQTWQDVAEDHFYYLFNLTEANG